MRAKPLQFVSLLLATTCSYALHAKTARKPVVVMHATVSHKLTARDSRKAAPVAMVHFRHDRRYRYLAIAPLSYRRERFVMPPALKGSHEILLHQNTMADLDRLDRVRDDYDLDDMRSSKLLVPIPVIAGMQTDERLPLNRRYCRPWTAEFLVALAQAHYARFHSRLQVNSAVRTVEFQQQLLRRNGNAAPAAGETASPHLTGQAIDLAKHGLSLSEIAWLRGYLLPLVQSGKVDVEEEFQQACFHISVYRKYAPQIGPERQIAQNHRVTGSSLGTDVR